MGCVCVCVVGIETRLPGSKIGNDEPKKKKKNQKIFPLKKREGKKKSNTVSLDIIVNGR